MSSLSIAKTNERIKRDSGSLSETVHVTVGNGQRRVYHDESDCPFIKTGDTMQWSRQKAQDNLRPPCKHCVLNETSREGNVGRRSLRDRLGIGNGTSATQTGGSDV